MIIHKEYPAGNIRFIRGFIILIIIGIGGKIVGIITKSSVKPILKNSVLITFSTISFIAIIEFIFMFISLSNGGGEAFSGKIWNTRYWNPINKLGFRDEKPEKGKKSVFFVGDSYTAGWGVKKTGDRFGEVAARELKKQGKTIKPDRMVLNKNKEVYLLDYKTGTHNTKYQVQLENYQNAIELMGYKVVKKSLIYIGEKISVVHL